MKNKKVLISATLVLLVTLSTVLGSLSFAAAPDLSVTLPIIAGGSPDVSTIEFSLDTTIVPTETSMMTYQIENPAVTADYVEEIGNKMGFTGSAGYIDDNSKLSMIQEEDGQVKQLSMWINSGALEYILLEPDLLFPSSIPNLPSYDEAKVIAIKFLETNGLLPSDINADEAVAEAGGTYQTTNTDTGEVTEEYVTHLLVRFPRSINNVEITGPGAQLEVRIGDDGVIAQTLKFYQQMTPYKEINMKSPEEAYNDLIVGKGSCNTLLDCESVTVKEVSLVYWMEPVDSDQEYLVPIYVFEGDCLNDSGEYIYPFVGYCQAVK